MSTDTETPPTFGWTPLCEEDPDRDGWCAYHRSACTEDGPGDALPEVPGLVYPEAVPKGTIARVRLAGERPDTYVAEVTHRFGGPAWAGSWHGFTLDKGKPVEVLSWINADAQEDPEPETAEPVGPEGIEDAVAWARSAADAVDKALLGYEPEDWQDAVRVLYSLRAVIEILRTADASLVRWLYLHGEHGIHLHVEGVPGDVSITRGRSKERWAAPEAVNAYVDRKIEDLGGEFPDPRSVVEWVLEVLPATQSTALRKTPLRDAGLDLEDFYASEPGNLQVNLPRAPR